MKLLNKICFLIAVFAGNSSLSFGQEGLSPNLIKNGDFEDGKVNFQSDYQYSGQSYPPGTYTITNSVDNLISKELKDPSTGDHSTGDGNFLIFNSDDKSARKIWRYKVVVEPNSVYRFSLYFLNVYKHQGANGVSINGYAVGYYPKNNFVKVRPYINGHAIGEEQTDMFHRWKWVYASWEWYSGASNGPVELSIDNPNIKSDGNDLAIDDIEFVLIETKPKGYKPPKRETVMLAENRPIPDNRIRLVTSPSEDPLDFFVGDSIGDGIYLIGKKRITPIRPEDKIIKVQNLVFEKGKSEMKPEAFEEIDKLYKHLIKFQGIKIRLEGHTDNLGDSTLNVQLSEERVNKVKQFLLEKGISPGRIETKGFGGTRPIANNDDEESRKQNRRVEVIIVE